MARYIDAGKVKDYILESECLVKRDEAEGMDIAVRCIDNAPTADVQPVVHGMWIESHNLDDCFWICSKCKFCSMATLAPKLYNYCPNCGSRMDGESNE